MLGSERLWRSDGGAGADAWIVMLMREWLGAKKGWGRRCLGLSHYVLWTVEVEHNSVTEI